MKTYCIECGAVIPGSNTKDGEGVCDPCADRLLVEIREDAERRGESLSDDAPGNQGGIKGCIQGGVRIVFFLAILLVFGSCLASEIRSRINERVDRAERQLERLENEQNEGYDD